MNCTLFSVVAISSMPGSVLLDSAVKGTALLMLAGVAVVILSRDSAATRYLVWMLAMVAMLVVPALSLMLPEWRVLPHWAEISPKAVVAETSAPSIAMPADSPVESPRNAEPVKIKLPASTEHQPVADLPYFRPTLLAPEVAAGPGVSRWNWSISLPLVWTIGICVLILRLLVARWMLWNTERQGTILLMAGHPAKAIQDPLVTALEAARLHLGIGRSVTLLIHSEKTIPVVWGILRYRLLLPAAARHWSDEKLRSVLLHELAHVKRRDTMGQLVSQIACALHWFNPLVWIAAWRLGMERERACDDLVLASGVRPSIYAEHLLDVATHLSPTRWTRACGLVMARKPSLEGRLVAVLSENLNRRGVPSALTAIALAVTVGIAVPIAMLRAADEKPGEKAKTAITDSRGKGGKMLNPGTEEKLSWGEPVGGLRAAIAIRPAPGALKPGEYPDFFLAVQNVLDAPIRLSDTTTAPDLRAVQVHLDGRIVSIISSKDPTGTDVTLQPREVVFLLMFATDKSKNARTMGSGFAEELLQDPRETIVAELQINSAPAGAWTGKLVTAEAGGEAAACLPRPKDPMAQTLFKQWWGGSRIDGKISGALVGMLGDKVRYFIALNKGDSSAGREMSVKFEKMLPRFDRARDWTPSEAVALLDDVSAIHKIPIENTLATAEENTIRHGEPLPAELADAPWGRPSPDGLRVAWLLEPRAKEYPLGTTLKSRILVHNSGKMSAIFIMPSWQQSSTHTTHDANGKAIQVTSTYWTTLARKVTYRLAPGDYCESPAPGVCVGAESIGEDWANLRAGAWIDAKPGDDVRFTAGAVEVRCSPSVIGTEMMDERPVNVDPKGAADLWEKIIAVRVERELPLPAVAAERERLLPHIMVDLFGVLPTPEEIAAFNADPAPTAQAALVKRLLNKPGVAPFTGTLPPGDISFRVLPVDLDADKRPRVVTGPGWYNLDEKVRLAVERTGSRYRGTNKATIQFFPSSAESNPPGKPYAIGLPDGTHTYAIAWERGAGVLWIKQKGMVRGFDFTNPAQVKETIFKDPTDLEKVPKSILDSLPLLLDVPIAPPASVRH